MEKTPGSSPATAEILLSIIRTSRKKPISALHQEAPASFPLKNLCRISLGLKMSRTDYLAAIRGLIENGALVLSGRMAEHRRGMVDRRLVVITRDQVPDWFGYDCDTYYVDESGKEFDITVFQRHLARMTTYEAKEMVRKEYCFVSLSNLRVSVSEDGLTQTIQAVYDRGDGPDGLNREQRSLRQNAV